MLYKPQPTKRQRRERKGLKRFFACEQHKHHMRQNCSSVTLTKKCQISYENSGVCLKIMKYVENVSESLPLGICSFFKSFQQCKLQHSVTHLPARISDFGAQKFQDLYRILTTLLIKLHHLQVLLIEFFYTSTT